LAVRWKKKSPKKMSARARCRAAGVEYAPKLERGFAGLDRMFERFMREGSCRYGEPLGVPCVSFGANAVCERDERICDVETEKGERYRREYE
jgi:hypothetical protein